MLWLAHNRNAEHVARVHVGKTSVTIGPYPIARYAEHGAHSPRGGMLEPWFPP